jgi:hypothetical protein
LFGSHTLHYSTPWRISLDGKCFLMMKESSTANDGTHKEKSIAAICRKIIVVTNWLEELRQWVPMSR